MPGYKLAIDGPAGSGKSTISSLIAKRLGWTHIDTGSMYRAVTLLALESKRDLKDEATYNFLETTKIHYSNNKIYIDSRDVSKLIRSKEVTKQVSLVASFSYVRTKLVTLQKQASLKGNIVMDGRDIGTVVMPHANLKIFLTAQIEERAKRRLKENFEKLSNQQITQIIKDIEIRDKKDSTRKESPLKKADDAIELDTTNLTIEQVVTKIIELTDKRRTSMDIKTLKVGQIVEGTVVIVEENTIYLDVQYYTEGKIHLDNYDKPAPPTFIGLVEVGQTVRARVQKMTNEPAQILLSRLPLLSEEKFAKIQALVESKETIKAKVRQVLDKGIILAYLENEIFLPFSLLDYDLVKDKDALRGKILEIQIIEATLKGRSKRIVASRKTIFEKARQEAYELRLQARKEELETINTGDIIKGVVGKIETHAATVRFKHVVGLLRISQVSHYRIEKIEDALTMGQEIEVKVIKKEGNRLDLSMKSLLKTPYEEFYDDHKIGEQVTGTVFQKLPFGIIVEVKKDVRGLLHKNEFSWNPNDNFDSYVKIGDEITLSIIALDPKKNRIALSKKALENNPWKNVTIKSGDVVKAIVESVSKEGLVVIADGVEAIIPSNELAVEKIGKPEDYFAKGDEVTAVVLEANRSNWSLKLSIRRVLEKMERDTFEKYLEDEEESKNLTLGDLFEDQFKK